MRINDIIDEATLYRGDSTPVEMFHSGSNDAVNLFGRGIYFTDSTEVAKEYSVKGKKYSPTKKQAVRNALDDIAENELGWADTLERLKDDFRDKLRNSDRSLYDEIQKEFEDEASIEHTAVLNKAVDILRKNKPRIAKNAFGAWTVMDDGARGSLSSFEIPNSVIEKTLDADAPMPPAVINTMAEAIPLGDFRDADGNHLSPSSFARWVEEYRQNGVMVAWKDRVMGGNGSSPSLSDYIKGTHDSTRVTYREPEMLKALLEPLGYMGIRFRGGIRDGDTVVGGGSSPHVVYVIWDADLVNQTRGETTDVEFDRARITKVK